MTASTGTCVVQYDQAGDTNYAPATQVTSSTSASAANYQLAVTVNGTGTGNVASVTPGVNVSCSSGICNTNLSAGTGVTLSANASPGSILNGLTGCDNVNGNQCSVTMNAPKNVTATFNLNKVRINGDSTPYGSIADAYSVVANGGVIKAQAVLFIESLVLNRNLGFTLSGGYDDSFNLRPDYTTVQGKVTLSGTGRVVVDKVKIK